MRHVFKAIAMLLLALPVPSQSQISTNGYPDFDAPETVDLPVVKVILKGGCFLYDEADNGNYIDREDDEFLWSGPCTAGQPIDGPGIFKSITVRGQLKGGWTEVSSSFRNGIMEGNMTWRKYVAFNPPDSRYFNGSGTFINGCNQGSENYADCAKDFATLSTRLKAKVATLQSVPAEGSRRAADMQIPPAAQSSVGRNAEQEANLAALGDWAPVTKTPPTTDAYLYDDINHGKCPLIKPIAENTGSQMAYGHYQLINTCSYPVKLMACVSTDRADGTPAPNYAKHVSGTECPGMGWGGTTLDANEVKEERAWYQYRNIRWSFIVCREGWDFVGSDGISFPSKRIDAEYRCRKARPR